MENSGLYSISISFLSILLLYFFLWRLVIWNNYCYQWNFKSIYTSLSQLNWGLVLLFFLNWTSKLLYKIDNTVFPFHPHRLLYSLELFIFRTYFLSFLATGMRGPLLCSYYLKKSVFCHLFVVRFHQKASTLRNAFFACILLFHYMSLFNAFVWILEPVAWVLLVIGLGLCSNTKFIVEVSHVEFSSTL